MHQNGDSLSITRIWDKVENMKHPVTIEHTTTPKCRNDFLSGAKKYDARLKVPSAQCPEKTHYTDVIDLQIQAR